MGIVKNTVVTERGLKATFMEAFNNGELPANIESLIMRAPSNKGSEKYGWLGSVPQMRVWADERNISGLNDFNYTIENISYESTIKVDRDEMEDDQIGAVNVRVRDLAKRAATHPTKLLFDLIAAGTTGLCFDGQAFFSTSHVLGKQAAQSNLLNGTGATFATVQADFRSARAALRGFVDDQGEVINQGNLKLAVVCSPALEGIIREVFAASLISSGATNVEKGQVSEENIHVSGRLTGNKWYLLELGEGVKPFIFQTRRNVEFNSLQNESEAGFMRKHFLYGVDYRAAMAYGLWQKAIMVNNT